jgi:AcrR family transcriptional regulator
MNVRSKTAAASGASLAPHLVGASREILELMNEHSLSRGARKKSGRRGGRPVVDDKRRRLLDAAIRIFSAKGFHGTSVPEVAEAAGVGTGTLYHYFENKQELVNEVYRDAKLALRSRLLDGLADPEIAKPGAAEAWFFEIWRRLAAYQRELPDAFHFLEMQDHVEYLDPESRQIELSTLAPMFVVAKRVHDRAGGTRVDVMMALMFGAFVGLVKAAKLGYLALDDASLEEAGHTVWRMFAPEAQRAARKR